MPRISANETNTSNLAAEYSDVSPDGEVDIFREGLPFTVYESNLSNAPIVTYDLDEAGFLVGSLSRLGRSNNPVFTVFRHNLTKKFIAHSHLAQRNQNGQVTISGKQELTHLTSAYERLASYELEQAINEADEDIKVADSDHGLKAASYLMYAITVNPEIDSRVSKISDIIHNDKSI